VFKVLDDENKKATKFLCDFSVDLTGFKNLSGLSRVRNIKKATERNALWL
jgi:hypothetical protein